MKKKKLIIVIFVVIVMIFCAYLNVIARTGGAGHSSSSHSSSHSSSSGGRYSGSKVTLPFPLYLIVVILMVALIIYMMRRDLQSSVFNNLTVNETSPKTEFTQEFLQRNGDFNQEEFIGKVKKIFFDVGEDWQNQDVSNVRRMISDGLYQRFTIQFKMMKVLKQVNIMEKIDLKDVFPIKMYTDGIYDVIDVRIGASGYDSFQCQLDPTLNQSGFEEYIEYWTFVRKTRAKNVDMYHNNNCPNCGAPLPNNLGEVSKCEYCNSILNSGEFDWVLSEITQAMDYVTTNKKLRDNSKFNENVGTLQEQYKDFSIQLMEDKASNAYLQILAARVAKDSSIMRRFVTNRAFDKIINSFSDDNIAYNRIFLNDVTILGIYQSDTQNVLAISVSSSYQRVKLINESIEKLDYYVTKRNEVIFMTRDKNPLESKGLLYMHNCPNCGAPISNTTSVVCEYCQSQLNSSKFEWIVDDILSMEEYKNFADDNKEYFDYRAKLEFLDSLMDVRDFAFNNVLVITGADGVFTEEERQFITKIAKKFGYNTEKIKPMIAQAQNRRLVIKMPEDMKARRKICKLIEKTAAIDRNVSPEEREVLDSIKKEYLMTENMK